MADRVDAVPAERLAHLVEVLSAKLMRVVELVVVDQVAEPVDGAPHLARRSTRRPAAGWYPPGTKRVTIGPRAQMPRLVFMRRSPGR